MKFPVFPDEASAAARQTDYLYWGLICISVLTLLGRFSGRYSCFFLNIVAEKSGLTAVPCNCRK